jgi:sugar lactone lactonase YvrE
MMIPLSLPISGLGKLPIAAGSLYEGPVWWRNAWYWVDIEDGSLHQWRNQEHRTVARAPGPLGCAVPAEDGTWIGAGRDGLYHIDLDTGSIEPWGSPWADGNNFRANDGKVAPDGSLWVGTLDREERDGSCCLYRIDHSGTPQRLREGLSLSNGMGWSPDGATYYHINTLSRTLSAYPWDPKTRTLSDERILRRWENGFPDGMAVAASGHLYVAIWGGSRLEVLSPEGKLLGTIPVPASQVSSCAFGGSDLKTLLITTAWEGFSLEQRQNDPDAGCLFEMVAPEEGLPITPFHLTASYR